MTLLMKELHISSSQRNQMIDITTNIQHIIKEEKINDGFVIVYIPHTTAGITINEGADPSVQQDLNETLQNMIPARGNYKHIEGNWYLEPGNIYFSTKEMDLEIEWSISIFVKTGN